MHRIPTVLLLTLCLAAPALAKPAAKPSIRWAPTSDRGFDQATEEGRLIVQFFTAPACDACKALEKTTFQDAEVVQFISDRFIAIRTDASKKENAEVLEEYGIATFPTVQFYTSAGKLISEATLRTFEAPEAFRTRLLDVASSRFGQSKAVVEKTPVLAPTGSTSTTTPVVWEKPSEKPAVADSTVVRDSSATGTAPAPATTSQNPAPAAPASP